MKIKRVVIILLTILAILPACTSFVFEQNGLYLAKNLDWEIDHGYLLYNLDGIQKQSVSDPDLQWVSKYKSITNNQFGKEFPLGGMNEKGLVIEELSLFGQAYSDDENKFLLNEFQWIQYQLDMSTSVGDVIKSLEKITIKHDLMNIHYIIADNSDDRAVVECLEEGVVVIRGKDLPYSVLSNNPYEKALRYLGFFKGFGGDMDIQYREGSQERFVSCVDLLNNGSSFVDPVKYAFDLLDRVRQEDTQWQFIYDIENLRIYCHVKKNSHLFEISFDKVRHIKHNQYAIPLYEDNFKKTKMTLMKNNEQIEFVYQNLDKYFPGKLMVFESMIKEGGESLIQK